jgi:hypothetical protein
MKILQIILLLLCVNIHAQDRNTIDSVITGHVKELRSTIGHEAYIFIEFSYDFPNKNIHLDERDLVVINGLNAKKVKRNKEYFLVKFILKDTGRGKLMLTAVNFRIKKAGSKSLDLVNLGNGNDYTL